MGWISNIADKINTALESMRTPLVTIPPILLLCEIANRPGLSAIALTSEIIRRLPEAGIETGVNPDGSPNKLCSFARIVSESVVTHIKDCARADCVLEAVPPLSVMGIVR